MYVKLLIVVALCVIGVAKAENSPVYLWGVSSDLMPAVSTVSQKDFEDLSKSLLEDHMIVIFEEEGLTGRDFSCSNNVEHKCYAYLRGVTPRNYYTSVKNPIAALRNAAKKHEYNSVDKTGQLSSKISWAANKAVFVTFDKTNDERATTLEAHDAAINAITNEIGGNTVFMYTPTVSNSLLPKSRQRRDTTGHGFRDGKTILLYFTNLFYNHGPISDKIEVKGIKVGNKTDTHFDVVLTTSDGKGIKFNMTLNAGYFKMGIVNYNDMNFRSSIEAPVSFSYSCGNTTMFGIPKDMKNTEDLGLSSSLIWSNFQIQAPFDDAKKDDFKFDFPWYCTGFVTSGILSGLFVVLIFLIILFTGVCWMMDINTMDRFDDPKGKTININASE